MAITETELLEHALVGFEARRAEIEERIEEVRGALNGAVAEKPRPKRVMSPEARARIIAAQKKRWAAYRRSKRGAK